MLRHRNQSANVAKIIAKKAAETLTPMTLELGGRNPAIVTKNANVRLAAKRLLWGKIMVSPTSCLVFRNLHRALQGSYRVYVAWPYTFTEQ